MHGRAGTEPARTLSRTATQARWQSGRLSEAEPLLADVVPKHGIDPCQALSPSHACRLMSLRVDLAQRRHEHERPRGNKAHVRLTAITWRRCTEQEAYCPVVRSG